MHVFETIASLRHHLTTFRAAPGESGRPNENQVGLVPTMGALHAGHLSLIAASREANALTVSSIFVNPIQFTNSDDLARYPRTLDDDLQQLEAAGCDIVFAPSVAEMYPAPATLQLTFGELETVMEGAFRPGHFNGVGIVVAKLFHIVQPDRAYFGQKDLQQVAVVRRLIRDLSFPVELVRVPTVREADGLALSSRNRNLTPEERRLAPELFRTLTLVRRQLENGAAPAEAKQWAADALNAQPAFGLEYVEVANADTLQPVEQLQVPGMTALCLAVRLGRVRLIDNLVF